jgi:hypothetical protein
MLEAFGRRCSYDPNATWTRLLTVPEPPIEIADAQVMAGREHSATNDEHWQTLSPAVAERCVMLLRFPDHATQVNVEAPAEIVAGAVISLAESRGFDAQQVNGGTEDRLDSLPLRWGMKVEGAHINRAATDIDHGIQVA